MMMTMSAGVVRLYRGKDMPPSAFKIVFDLMVDNPWAERNALAKAS